MNVNTDLARALLAGWLSGAAAGLAITAILLVTAARRPMLAHRLPWQGRLVVFGILAANATVFALTLVGLVLGALQHRTHGDGRFSLMVVAGVVVLGGLYVFIRGRVRTGEAPAVVAALVVVALAFAVMLPALAAA